MKDNQSAALAVIFPGIGYHVDKPLLYYAKKLAREAGYEIKDVPYGGFPAGVKGSQEKMQAAFEQALVQAEEILKDIEWDAFDEILFISKSVGTAVAAAYAERHGLTCRNLFFTPVEQSFSLMKNPGIVFTGTADPWVAPGSVPRLCRDLGYPLTVIEGGNHSLETGDAALDLANLVKIMDEVKEYIGRSGNE